MLAGSLGGYAWLLRLGKRKVVVLFTGLSVLVSLQLTWLALSYVPGGRPGSSIVWWSLVVSGVIPLIITPFIAVTFMNVLVRLERALGQVQELALTDPLTGLRNRRSFMQSSEVALAESLRAGRSVSVLMIDIDDFKAINDQHGHFVGDNVLVAVATACARCAGQEDIVARFGGEEFVVLLADAPLAIARDMANAICRQVEQLAVTGNGRAVACSVSIGVAGALGAACGLEELLHSADKHLYRAKSAGKSQVSVDGGHDATALSS